MADNEPKIIIDEDWKSQVEREREESQSQPEAAPESSETGEPGETMSHFEELVSGLAAQVMMALGMMTEPDQKEVMVDLPYAKHVIDTLTMLKDKTHGNLTPHEVSTMTKIVSDLQRAFVVRSQQVQESALKGATQDLSQGP